MNFRERYLAEIATALVIFLIFWGFLQSAFFVTLADKINFTVFHWSGEKPDPNIVIVAFDDKTLNSSEFPGFQDFSRADYARLLQDILKENPQVIGLDVFFFNPSENPEEDGALSEVLAENRNIVAVNEFDFANQEFLFPSETLDIPPIRQGYVNLLSKTLDKHSAIAHIPLILDTKNVQLAQFEPFAFRLWRAIQKSVPNTAQYEDGDYVLLAGEKRLIVPSENDLVNINFFGNPGAFPRFSLIDVWTGNIPADSFRDKVVLIGATAKDLHDEFITPLSGVEMMPGVEIHANALQMLRTGKFLSYQSATQKILILALVLLIGLFSCMWFRFAIATVSIVLIAAGMYVGAVILFLERNLITDFTVPILALVLFWGVNYTLRFLGAEKQKRHIRETFSKYVSKDIVNEMLKHPEKVDLGGVSREVTVFFSDLTGFTALSEKLGTTETMELLNSYLDTMSSVILEEQGTIDKYMGDAIMAFWGAPLDCPDHAAKACRAALAQQKALPEINARLEQQGFPTVAMRIGINSGKAHVGNIGTKERLEYTAIGDNINLGSRLEGINRQYGTNILISECTKNLIGDKFFVREIDAIRVKGKTKPLKIFELVAVQGKQTKEQEHVEKIYTTGLRLYRTRKWDEAVKKLTTLKNDPAAQTLIRRISMLRKENLGKEWDGVYTFMEK